MTCRRVAALVAIVLVAACGSEQAVTASSDLTSSSAPTSAPTTTPHTVDPPEVTVDPVGAYRDAVAAYSAAGDPPDPLAAGLADAYTGDALLKARAALGRSRSDGIASRGERTVESAVLTAQDGDLATVHACVRDNQARYRVADGELVAEAPGTVAAVTVTMAFVDGRWKVSVVSPGDGC